MHSEIHVCDFFPYIVLALTIVSTQPAFSFFFLRFVRIFPTWLFRLRGDILQWKFCLFNSPYFFSFSFIPFVYPLSFFFTRIATVALCPSGILSYRLPGKASKIKLPSGTKAVQTLNAWEFCKPPRLSIVSIFCLGERHNHSLPWSHAQIFLFFTSRDQPYLMPMSMCKHDVTS